MEKLQDVIIAHTLDRFGTDTYDNYLAHALCLEGSCTFLFNNKEFEFNKGDLMIVRKVEMVEGIRPSEDFQVRVIYASYAFIELCTPQSNYGMKGQLALFLNPVMHLLPEQQYICLRDFELVEYRLQNTDHNFYRDMLINAVQMMILDFFDFHSRLHEEEDISTQNASIMNRFLAMLERGEYRTYREVSHYADALFITPKYLSEVSKKVSGFAAGYWINRYTVLDLSRLLRDKSLTFVEISDLFGFSSSAYFSRFVQHNLGLNPTDYRDRTNVL